METSKNAEVNWPLGTLWILAALTIITNQCQGQLVWWMNRRTSGAAECEDDSGGGRNILFNCCFATLLWRMVTDWESRQLESLLFPPLLKISSKCVLPVSDVLMPAWLWPWWGIKQTPKRLLVQRFFFPKIVLSKSPGYSRSMGILLQACGP